jgi:hypothetical protein
MNQALFLSLIFSQFQFEVFLLQTTRPATFSFSPPQNLYAPCQTFFTARSYALLITPHTFAQSSILIFLHPCPPILFTIKLFSFSINTLFQIIVEFATHIHAVHSAFAHRVSIPLY